MGDYRQTEAAPVGDDPALDALGQAVCQTGGHIPPRDRSLAACDFHRRMAAGYLRVVTAAQQAVEQASWASDPDVHPDDCYGCQWEDAPIHRYRPWSGYGLVDPPPEAGPGCCYARWDSVNESWWHRPGCKAKTAARTEEGR